MTSFQANVDSGATVQDDRSKQLLQNGFEAIDFGEIEDEMKKSKASHLQGDIGKSSVGDGASLFNVNEEYIVNNDDFDLEKLQLQPELHLRRLKKSLSEDDAISKRTKKFVLKPKRCINCNQQFFDSTLGDFCSGECKYSCSNMVFDDGFSLSSSNSSISFIDVGSASIVQD